MERITEPLKAMGALIETTQGKLPVKLQASKLKGTTLHSSVASAQIKSAVLLAGLGAEGLTRFKEPELSRDHTERLMKSLDIPLKTYEDGTIQMEALKVPIPGFTIELPSDPSSAAFFAAATILLEGSELTLSNVLLNPTRIEFFKVLLQMGAQVEYQITKESYQEPIGDIHIKSSCLKGITLEANNIAWLIDELPMLAILATQAEGLTIVRGSQRVKTQRIRSH